MEQRPSEISVHQQIIDRAAEMLIEQMKRQREGLPTDPGGAEQDSPHDSASSAAAQRPASDSQVFDAQPDWAPLEQLTAQVAPDRDDKLQPTAQPTTTHRPSSHLPARMPRTARPNRSIWRQHPGKIIGTLLIGVIAAGMVIYERHDSAGHIPDQRTPTAAVADSWGRLPETVTVWNDLIDQAAQDPRTQVQVGGTSYNYVLNSGHPGAKGKKAGPAHMQLAEAVIILVSAGDPKYANSQTGQQGLIPLSPASRQKYASELNQTNQTNNLDYTPLDPNATDPGTILLEFDRLTNDLISSYVSQHNGKFPDEKTLAQLVASNADFGNYSTNVQSLIVELDGLLASPPANQQSILSPEEAAQDAQLPNPPNAATLEVELGSLPGYANLVRNTMKDLSGSIQPIMSAQDSPLKTTDYEILNSLSPKQIQATYRLPK